MRFIVDAQLPPALARWLTSQGHDAAHVADIDMAASSDDAIWNHAIDTGAVIVSKDDDFVDKRNLAETGPHIVWIRFGNASRAQTIARFESSLEQILDALEQNEPLVEVA